MKKLQINIICLLLLLSGNIWAQESPKEEDFYKIVTLPVPEGVLLEVGRCNHDAKWLFGFGNTKRRYLDS